MEEDTPTTIINTRGAASVAHVEGATPIQISIVNQGDVTNIDSSGNTLSSRENDVIAVLGQLFESEDETLHQMAEQIVVKQAELTPLPKLVPTDTLHVAAETLVESYQHRPFVCHCGKTYKSKSHLKYHQKVHNNARTYVCKWCKQSFMQLGHLKRHERIHTLVKPFSCDVCRKSFRQKAHLICHKLIHTDEKPYKCEICSMAFRKRSAIARHKTRRHTVDQHYVCSVCSCVYSGPSDLRRHERTHVNITYFAVLNLKMNTSKICGLIQDDFIISDLPPKPKIEEDTSENKMDRSDVTNTSNISGILNKPDTLLNPPRPFSCDVCGKTYKNKGHLAFHAKVHLADRPYKCIHCDKSFVQKGHLQRHVMVHTNEKPYVCQVCKKVFRQSSHLNDHVKIHGDNRPNVCHVCTKGFRQTSALKKHIIRMHSSLEAFTCDACNKSYRLEADLKRHQLTSCGQTPKPRSKRPSNEADEGGEKNGAELKRMPKPRPCRFNCEVCSKPFPSRSKLKVHMRTHTDERPFECGICGKSFKLQPHLKDHMLIHTGEKPFTCNICKHTFRRDSALKRHILSMHPVTKSHL